MTADYDAGPEVLRELDERSARLHEVALAVRQAAHGGVPRRPDGVLHLHRLENEQDLAPRDRLPFRDVDFSDPAGHRRPQIPVLARRRRTLFARARTRRRRRRTRRRRGRRGGRRGLGAACRRSRAPRRRRPRLRRARCGARRRATPPRRRRARRARGRRTRSSRPDPPAGRFAPGIRPAGGGDRKRLARIPPAPTRTRAPRRSRPRRAAPADRPREGARRGPSRSGPRGTPESAARPRASPGWSRPPAPPTPRVPAARARSPPCGPARRRRASRAAGRTRGRRASRGSRPSRRARPGRRAPRTRAISPERGRKVDRILGVQAQLDRVAARRQARPVVRQRPPRGHLELRADEIDPERDLGDRVLDLEARVHLEEVEVALLVEQELDRSGARCTRRRGPPRPPPPPSGSAARLRARGSASPRRSSGAAAGRCTRARRGG